MNKYYDSKNRNYKATTFICDTKVREILEYNFEIVKYSASSFVLTCVFMQPHVCINYSHICTLHMYFFCWKTENEAFNRLQSQEYCKCSIPHRTMFTKAIKIALWTWY